MRANEQELMLMYGLIDPDGVGALELLRDATL